MKESKGKGKEPEVLRKSIDFSLHVLTLIVMNVSLS